MNRFCTFVCVATLAVTGAFAAKQFEFAKTPQEAKVTEHGPDKPLGKPEKTPTAGKGGWVSMFDGKTLDGWKAGEHPENWKVVDGTVTGGGPRSHLFWEKEQCQDCEWIASVKINHNGNSGMYTRCQSIVADWPKGYESQVNVSHKDPVKTGSLYNIVKRYDQLVRDDTWFTQRIRMEGDHIQIWVNGIQTVDTHDKTYAKGYIALQAHDPGSVMMYKDMRFRSLPVKK
ncbi:MAG: DUF1080 domain-containing protein [Bryobacteraceae bacterium]|nr:DUF1080 domain-containing protein [Bryobacteraceae bacterium]